MAYHTVGFAQDVDLAGVDTNITPLAGDTSIFSSTTAIRVPVYSELVGGWAGLGSGGDGTASLSSPSLRDSGAVPFSSVNGLTDADQAANSAPIAMGIDLRNNPRSLVQDENMTLSMNTNTSAAAWQWAFLNLASGPLVPIQGAIQTQRATGSTTVTAREWSDVVLSFDTALDFGVYSVVGLRALGATMVAARFSFKGSSGIDSAIWWRSGVPAVVANTTPDAPGTRWGESGSWGSFQSTNPPSIEVACNAADSAQTFWIDLIQTA